MAYLDQRRRTHSRIWLHDSHRGFSWGSTWFKYVLLLRCSFYLLSWMWCCVCSSQNEDRLLHRGEKKKCDVANWNHMTRCSCSGFENNSNETAVVHFAAAISTKYENRIRNSAPAKRICRINSKKLCNIYGDSLSQRCLSSENSRDILKRLLRSTAKTPFFLFHFLFFYTNQRTDLILVESYWTDEMRNRPNSDDTKILTMFQFRFTKHMTGHMTNFSLIKAYTRVCIHTHTLVHITSNEYSTAIQCAWSPIGCQSNKNISIRSSVDMWLQWKINALYWLNPQQRNRNWKCLQQQKNWLESIPKTKNTGTDNIWLFFLFLPGAR